MRLVIAKRRIPIFSLVVLSVLAFGILFPFWWMVSTSFDKTAVTALPFPMRFLPKELSINAYNYVFKSVPLIRYFVNTIVVTLGVIIISTSSALLAGYALSKINFKGKVAISLLTLGVLMLPQEVVMIPQYLLFAKLGLTNNYIALWIPGFCYVFGTFFVKQNLDTIPDSLKEAAVIDGASEWKVFSRVYLPLSSTVIATLIILLFLFGWNDLLWPLLILRDNEKFTIQLGVAFATSRSTAGGATGTLPAVNMALSIISVLPVVIVYLFMQRFIISSIALSGIKQ